MARRINRMRRERVLHMRACCLSQKDISRILGINRGSVRHYIEKDKVLLRKRINSRRWLAKNREAYSLGRKMEIPIAQARIELANLKIKEFQRDRLL